jgi:GntR family transcriptional regulator
MPTSRPPRYHQIALDLKERIRSGELEPGHRLNNQRRLADEFGVTLMTLRQALDLLGREGLITRRHGRGTYVTTPTIDYDILQLQAFANDLRDLGESVETRVLSTRFVAADGTVAESLRLKPGESVLMIERLRLVRGQPMSHQTSFLPGALGEEVMRADLVVHSLRSILRFKLGIEITRAYETVTAVRLKRHEAEALGRSVGVPAFCSERISFSTSDEPIVFDRVYVPGDHFRITRELRYDTREPRTPDPGRQP